MKKTIQSNWRPFLSLFFFPFAFFYILPRQEYSESEIINQPQRLQFIGCPAPSVQIVFDSSLESITINNNQQPAGEMQQTLLFLQGPLLYKKGKPKTLVSTLERRVIL